MQIDANKIGAFAMHWAGAGFWGFFGWTVAAYVERLIPWPL